MFKQSPLFLTGARQCGLSFGSGGDILCMIHPPLGLTLMKVPRKPLATGVGLGALPQIEVQAQSLTSGAAPASTTTGNNSIAGIPGQQQ